jgi:hypothetical protein
MPTSKRADLSRVLPAVRCTARKRNGEPCRAMAARGASVCRVHGGSAPQVKAAALRRLDQAADVLVQRLLQFALDGNVDDNVALRAIRDALDRAGLAAKTEVAVEVAQAPWEELMGDVMQISKAQHEAMMRGEPLPPALQREPSHAALPPGVIVDAELVPDAHVSPPDSTGATPDADERAASRPPPFAEPTRPPSRALAPLEDVMADVNRANRAARVVQVRRIRSQRG